MRFYTIIIGFACCLIVSACRNKPPQKAEDIAPPIAKKETKIFEEHGNRRFDDYFWMSNPEDSAVIALLDAENVYSSKMLAHTEGLQNVLFKEIMDKQELQKKDLPIKKNGYWYYNRYELNQAFPLVCRKKETWSGAEEVLLNLPVDFLDECPAFLL